MILKVIIIDKEKVNYSMPIERKLAAIMFTDIAGYTAQMSKDEDKAFALIQKKRELLLPLIEQYEGNDVNEIHSLIKDDEDIEFEVNFRLYELLDDKSYLKSAYNQVQEKASAMDDGEKFLSYPIPKAIVEAWESS